MKAFLNKWSQPRAWPHVVELGTPVLAEGDSGFDCQHVEGLSLREFAQTRLVLTLDSSVLGELVMFASDSVPMTKQMDHLTTYRARELSQLVGVTVDQLQKIHFLKKTFRATIELVRPTVDGARSDDPR